MADNEGDRRIEEIVQANKEVQEKSVARRAEARNKSVEDYYARSESAQPTPTQEENDLARVGALNIDEKEDDGSEWEDERVKRVMMGNIPGNSPYDTRDLTADEGGESTPRRRGRKRGG